jgi:ribosomal-protein-alanine N-acetyltransferase
MLKENIITERLVLRNMTIEDAKDVYQIWSTEENSKYMCDPVESIEEIESIFLSPESSDNYLLVVIDNNLKDIIGTICFGPTTCPHEWGFGYSFKKSAWGNGYARETVKSIIKFGISQGIKTFVSDCAAENTGLANVLSKCG